MESIVQVAKKNGKKLPVKKVSPVVSSKVVITDEMIAKKAYEIYEKNGSHLGHAEEDWLEAKRILEA